MKSLVRLVGAGALAAAAIALFALPAAADSSHGDDHARAVFVQSDDPAGNTVVAYQRAADGTLTQTGVYPTGGLGGILAGSVVDHLASQGSLAYDAEHELLYAVNAGSDTVTVFSVNGDHLDRQQTIGSGGSFPASIAVSGNNVYVLNARAGGSVQGFRREGNGLRRIADSQRALGLDAAAVPEFTHTPGQVAVSPDGAKLLVTTKANGSNVLVFDVNRRGGLSAVPVVNNQPGAVPFALTFDKRGNVVVAQAGLNAVSTYALGGNGILTSIATAPTGQAATCWIVGSGKNFYASNAGSGSVSGFQVNRNGTLTALGNTATDGGTVDAAASSDGRYLYVQAGRNGIVDEFRIGGDGSLTSIGSVTVPGAVGGEGIVAT